MSNICGNKLVVFYSDKEVIKSFRKTTTGKHPEFINELDSGYRTDIKVYSDVGEIQNNLLYLGDNGPFIADVILEESKDGCCLEYAFRTKNGPPIHAILELSEAYPKIIFSLGFTVNPYGIDCYVKIQNGEFLCKYYTSFIWTFFTTNSPEPDREEIEKDNFNTMNSLIGYKYNEKLKWSKCSEK